MSGDLVGSRPLDAAPVAALTRWEAVHESQTGASHVRDGTVCQDDSTSWAMTYSDGTSWAFIAVADGHGSAAYFRSDRGARLAVEALTSAVRAFHTAALSADSQAPTVDWDDWAPRHVVARWREGVLRDLTADPPRFGDREAGVVRFLDRLRTSEGYDGIRGLERQFEAFARYADANPVPRPEEALDPERFGRWQLKAYGATLLGVLIGPESLHWLAIGDGAIVAITGGEPSYLVEPPTEAIANETPSLCAHDAIRSVRAGTVDLRSGLVPSAIVASTDGVVNSYETREGFFQFCVDIARAAQPTDDFHRQLADWLATISSKGSGDDMSVAMAWANEPAPQDAPTEASDDGAADAETLAEAGDEEHGSGHAER
jgi:serine/threonine protein phosphatase PrpC